jgi:C4-dicarboxylate-specific signal transduction histidine kinase
MSAISPQFNPPPPPSPESDYQFDFRTVLGALQALSSEISLVKIIHVLFDSAVRYADADRAVLCLMDDGIPHVVAEATYSDGAVAMRMETTLMSAEILPTSVTCPVLRTRQSLVLHDAKNDTRFGRDAYIAKYRPRSLLCVPMLRQEMLVGLLYVENRRSVDRFTIDKVQMLEVLASQAVISLENARLYADLEAENQARSMAESRLRETQEKLDRVAKLTAMGEMVAAIVHEVSQPLGAVGMCSRAALRWLGREVPNLDEARAMLNQISADSVRAANIVASLRSMAKKAPLRLDAMDMNEAIREVLGLVQAHLRTGDISVRGNFGTGSVIVRGDRILLQQVLMNLVINACEAMSAGSCRCRVLDIRHSVDEDGMFWVEVSDTGPGLGEESALVLFEPFYTTKDSGMGIGLSICKSIVDAHGGRIEANRSVRNGASFRFSVPQ